MFLSTSVHFLLQKSNVPCIPFPSNLPSTPVFGAVVVWAMVWVRVVLVVGMVGLGGTSLGIGLSLGSVTAGSGVLVWLLVSWAGVLVVVVLLIGGLGFGFRAGNCGGRVGSWISLGLVGLTGLLPSAGCCWVGLLSAW